MALTTDSSGIDFNGELAPLPPGGVSTHSAFYRLSGTTVAPEFGTFFLNVPDTADQNTNGVPDFYEVDQPVAITTTTGTFEHSIGIGPVTTTWSRPVNSKDGTCRLVMDSNKVAFTVAFEIQEFSGSLSYSNSVTNIVGIVSVAKRSQPARTLSGRVSLEKVSPDRVAMEAGVLTNEVGQFLAFDRVAKLDREGADYLDFLLFHDGDPNTREEDFVVWRLRIHDPNDADGNGVPDLSDAAGTRRPTLQLSRSSSQLLATIGGDIGKVHELQTVASLGQTNWSTTTSLTLTNDPQTFTLSLPTNRTAFWRVRVP